MPEINKTIANYRRHIHLKKKKNEPVEVEVEVEHGSLQHPVPISENEHAHQLKKNGWVDNFREIYNEDRHFAKHWFWDNFDWSTQSIWIGKFNQNNNLPSSDENITDFLQRIIRDFNQYNEIKSEIYIKFYFSRKVNTNEPEINYLLICNHHELPEFFSNTLVNVLFEKYPLTQNILNQDKDFKRLLNHYLNWSNFYIYYNLMGELQC